MAKLVRESLIKEAYGAGYSYIGGGGAGFRGGMGGTSRGGFGGGWNYGGPNTMYTYEVKPLNHTLEFPTSNRIEHLPSIKRGSKITGSPVISNAYPDSKKRFTGIVLDMVRTPDGTLKYYIIQDEATQNRIKINPIGAVLNIYEPIRYHYNAVVGSVPSRRRIKIQNSHNRGIKEGCIVRESLV